MPLSLLIIEDSDTDTRLLLHYLKRAGLEPDFLRVDTRESMLAALDSHTWDLIISDHAMPAFSAPAALEVVRERGIDLPFIIVSGAIGEQAAVDAMKAGAQDYIMKNQLARLPAAIERELKEARERKLRREAEERIHQLAFYDELTGLPNRAWFRDQLDRLFKQRGRTRAPAALLCLRLDNLQAIANTLGYVTGEHVVLELADRMRAATQPPHLLARVLPDTFALVLPEGEALAARRVARELQDALRDSVRLGAVEVEPATSAGIALFPAHGDETELLLQHAAVALALVERGSDNAGIYDPAHDPYQPERLAMIGELRRAIDLGQLELHYQPKVDFGSRSMMGVEALVRWRHPRLGMIPPDRFVPLAEQTGLIHPLTRRVFADAKSALERWRRAGTELSMALNLSTRSLRNADLTSDLAEAFTRFGETAEHVVLEVTESAIMSDEQSALDLLDTLHAQGMSIAIDDFGTGYSSFSNLRRLPVSEIKIDKSFVLSMVEHDHDRVIVSSILDLGHALGLHVVAEGVETRSAWDALADLRCDSAQGYYLSRPLPSDELLAWSRAHAGGPPRA